MKRSLVLLFAAALFSVTAPAALVLDYSSTVGTVMNFYSGGTFDFTGIFGVDSTSGFPAPPVEGVYTMEFEAPAGGWVIGPIVESVPPPPINALAPVSGVGKFRLILDAVNYVEADLSWGTIGTLGDFIGGLNVLLVANVGNFQRLGATPDANLDALAAQWYAKTNFTFQNVTINSPQAGASMLAQLVEFGGTSSATSGSLTADVPEPGTYAMLGAGLLGLAVLRRRTAK